MHVCGCVSVEAVLRVDWFIGTKYVSGLTIADLVVIGVSDGFLLFFFLLVRFLVSERKHL